VADIGRAVVGELTVIALWGGRGREGSRSCQLYAYVYILLVNTVTLVLIAVSPLGHLFGFSAEYSSQFDLRPFAITILVAGWMTLPVFIFQIYLRREITAVKRGWTSQKCCL
jgi:hypothetical protein